MKRLWALSEVSDDPACKGRSSRRSVPCTGVAWHRIREMGSFLGLPRFGAGCVYSCWPSKPGVDWKRKNGSGVNIACREHCIRRGPDERPRVVTRARNSSHQRPSSAAAAS